MAPLSLIVNSPHKRFWMLGIGVTMATLLSTANSASADSEDPYVAGRQLAQRVYDRPDGDDMSTRGTMTLVDAGRDPRVREYYTYALDRDGHIRTLTRFTNPPDIAGTGFLVHDHPDGRSDQWLFLPAGERVRRIASSRRGGRFVGSDIYYEDLQDRKPDMDRHKLRGEEELDGVKTLVLESTPVDPSNSVYTKRVSWIHPEMLIVLRQDNYQGGDEPVKRQQVHRVERIQNYWTVMDQSIVDLQSGHQTRLIFTKVVYDRDLPVSLFSESALTDSEFEVNYRP